MRAGLRYDQTDGGRLASAVTYQAFFAVFAMALLGFAVLGYVLDNPTVLHAVQSYLAENLPRLQVQALRDARGTAGIIALVGLPVTGLFWVDALRSALRAVWRLNEYPGNFFLRQLIDLAVLAGLAVLLAASLTVALTTRGLLDWLVLDAAGADRHTSATAGATAGTAARWLLATAGFLLGIAVNTVLAIAVLTGLPRLRMPLRRVLGPALLVAAGLEGLKTLGGLYVQRMATNPAYQVVASAVGLLVFLKILNQLIMFAAALTATSHTGQVTDLATRPPTPLTPTPLTFLDTPQCPEDVRPL